MNFLITSYIYPLAESKELSNRFNYYFDNPRTKEEIEVVKIYLENSYYSGYDITFPIHSEEILSMDHLLMTFYNQFADKEEYIKDIFTNYNPENFFRFLASIWVIIRFDNMANEFHQYSNNNYDFNGMHPLVYYDSYSGGTAREELTNYTYLLSLLTHTESGDYFGRGIILNHKISSRSVPSNHVWIDFTVFAQISSVFPEIHQESIWKFFPTALPLLVERANKLDTILTGQVAERLSYIGSVLKSVGNEVHDERIRIVMLTSILELLLTHNPDNSKFNVEDSINKQFQLKVATLVYLNDTNKDIKDIKNRLKTIYQQRSNIAHGNFSDFNKLNDKLLKEEKYIDGLIVDLYEFIRAVIEEFIRHGNFVEFLKSS